MCAESSQIAQQVGEVILAGTTEFTAQSYTLFELPPLGSLVKTRDGEYEIYAVVYQAVTQGLDPGRPALARGRGEVSEEAVYQANPQLGKLLKSEFHALVIGFSDGNCIFQYLPPHPARLHGFVYACSAEDVRAFSARFGFLHLLVNARVTVPLEELVAASLRQMSRAQENDYAFLALAGKELAQLLGRDYSQLKAILERINPRG
jgi:hypothetical protein